ncbi:ABC transporter ATP-binding protein [Aurantimonas sp. A2-1-M11]|uniref:ABC transporter ATP-binding protein n=1 Tax=Aurantimonas sp. A2-1-M11 TaxID=3113712 RepID=UPI002F958143
MPRRAKLARLDSRLVSSDGRQVVKALHDVSFSLQSGDRLGLVGSNGSGKTTLLKVLYGVYQPSAGRIEIDGRVDALFDVRLGFNPEATGRRNLILRGLINGWTPSEIESRMEAAISFSELGEFIDLPLKTYSAGMAARLGFSIATSFEPEILLLDEWIGAGDPAFQAKARERMDCLARSAGIVVLASHNQTLLKRICNKVLVLENGRVATFENAAEWFARSPDN